MPVGNPRFIGQGDLDEISGLGHRMLCTCARCWQAKELLCVVVVCFELGGYLVNVEQMKCCDIFFSSFFAWLTIPYRLWKVSEIIYR